MFHKKPELSRLDQMKMRNFAYRDKLKEDPLYIQLVNEANQRQSMLQQNMQQGIQQPKRKKIFGIF
jgi:hypothetical protein